jgi:hypothetical protein
VGASNRTMQEEKRSSLSDGKLHQCTDSDDWIVIVSGCTKNTGVYKTRSIGRGHLARFPSARRTGPCAGVDLTPVAILNLALTKI